MTVLVLGSFDVLHYGHIRFLNHARRLGDLLIGLGTDEYQEGYKRRPVLNYWERKAALEALGYEVVARPEVSIKQICAEHNPDYLVAGSDWINQPFLELSGIDQAYLERNEITLAFVPREHDMSSSEVIRRIGDSFNGA